MAGSPERLRAQEIWQAYPLPRPNFTRLAADLAAEGFIVSQGCLRAWKARGYLGPRKKETISAVRLVKEELPLAYDRVKARLPSDPEKVTRELLDRMTALSLATCCTLLQAVNEAVTPRMDEKGADLGRAATITSAKDVQAAASAASLITRAMDDVLVHHSLLKALDEADANNAAVAAGKAVLPNPIDFMERADAIRRERETKQAG